MFAKEYWNFAKIYELPRVNDWDKSCKVNEKSIFLK
jgi:hypothetical protein